MPRTHDSEATAHSPLHAFLWSRMDQLGLTVRELAAALGLNSHAYAHRVLNGVFPFPMEQFDRWANALKLNGREREEFLDMVMHKCLPPSMVARLESDARRIQELQVRVSSLETALYELAGPQSPAR